MVLLKGFGVLFKKQHDSLSKNQMKRIYTFPFLGSQIMTQHTKLGCPAKFGLLHFLLEGSSTSCPLVVFLSLLSAFWRRNVTLCSANFPGIISALTDRPAIVPEQCSCALTLNSLAGQLPVSASSSDAKGDAVSHRADWGCGRRG